MSQIEFFLAIFPLYLLATVAGIVGTYLPGRMMWITYTNNTIKIFNKENKLNNISFIIKEHKYKYLSWFIFFIFFNCLPLGIFLWLWISDAKILHQGKNLILILPFILVWLLSITLILILYKKFWREIKKIGIYSKKEAISNFQKFQKEIKIENTKFFEIMLNDEKNIYHNFPMQYNQKRFLQKIKQLNKKKINQDKYTIKLLNLFIKYLKIYGVLLKRVENTIGNSNLSVMIENNKEVDILNVMPDILINNFFTYTEIK